MRTKILAIGFFLLFAVLFSQGFWINSHDDSEWRHMASDFDYGAVYQSWLKYPASLFVFNDFVWIMFLLALFGLFTPIAIYWYTKTWISIPLYFSITNYFFVIISSGLYAQGLAILLLICFFAAKDWRLKAVFFVLGLFSHSTGFYLFPFALAMLLIEKNLHLIKKLVSKNKLWTCSPLLGTRQIPIIEHQIGLGRDVSASWFLTIKDLLAFLVKICPIYFFVIAIINWYESKNFAFFMLLVAAFVFAFLQNSRALLIVAPFTVIGFSLAFKNLRYKKIWVVLVIFQLTFNLQQYIWLVKSIGC